MANTTTITTGCNADFFHFFQGLVLSVREKPQGSTIDISVVDLGMSPAQIEWLEDQKVTVANPDWEYGSERIVRLPDRIQGAAGALACPQIFPRLRSLFSYRRGRLDPGLVCGRALHCRRPQRRHGGDAGDRSLLQIQLQKFEVVPSVSDKDL